MMVPSLKNWSYRIKCSGQMIGHTILTHQFVGGQSFGSHVSPCRGCWRWNFHLFTCEPNPLCNRMRYFNFASRQKSSRNGRVTALTNQRPGLSYIWDFCPHLMDMSYKTHPQKPPKMGKNIALSSALQEAAPAARWCLLALAAGWSSLTGQISNTSSFGSTNVKLEPLKHQNQTLAAWRLKFDTQKAEISWDW